MAGQSCSNPTGRFTGLAELFAQCLPGYPAAALDLIMTPCGLSQNSVLVDVGCGTGTSSRLFSRRGLRVLGIEPNADMRARAGEPLRASLLFQDAERVLYPTEQVLDKEGQKRPDPFPGGARPVVEHLPNLGEGHLLGGPLASPGPSHQLGDLPSPRQDRDRAAASVGDMQPLVNAQDVVHRRR
jgi:SAM-dependent methyltransferase